MIRNGHEIKAGANLIGADLEGADLRGANLFRADLRGANLVGANLVGANLEGTILDPNRKKEEEKEMTNKEKIDLLNQRLEDSVHLYMEIFSETEGKECKVLVDTYDHLMKQINKFTQIEKHLDETTG